MCASQFVKKKKKNASRRLISQQKMIVNNDVAFLQFLHLCDLRFGTDWGLFAQMKCGFLAGHGCRKDEVSN